eukprot:CAMPEP_0113489542 /NCGR_PEP_ID=MMETSP0014_2-20120614/26582_1 /TAXON_ID=2857 /ORGANISM="Nitzschia sp." /LENGTH=96 /DNA_ID=CAMNT_0000383281 /DNA_START=291 /DNA_END=581 /DNA_ORIENTATION=- /assembly_acc=CAM_ASM_000159
MKSTTRCSLGDRSSTPWSSSIVDVSAVLLAPNNIVVVAGAVLVVVLGGTDDDVATKGVKADAKVKLDPVVTVVVIIIIIVSTAWSRKNIMVAVGQS